MADNTALPERSYGCTFGDGNPYDFVLISVRDGSTEFLCLPCMVRLAADMVEAVTNPDSNAVKTATQFFAGQETAPTRGTVNRGKGRNAPATNLDPELFDAFDSVVTTEDLPEDFR
jgi:hypothetical protein